MHVVEGVGTSAGEGSTEGLIPLTTSFRLWSSACWVERPLDRSHAYLVEGLSTIVQVVDHVMWFFITHISAPGADDTL